MESSDSAPARSQPDWTQLLPREAFHEIMLILRSALPPPLTDDPADCARRDRAAMAGVAALLPVTAAEGRLAAQFVAADAWAMDCLRLARERRLEFEVARKCRAQALSLMRESKGALRALLRLQAGRRAMEADDAAANRAAWVEHGALGMMGEALAAGSAGSEGMEAASGPAGDAGPRAGTDGADGPRAARPGPAANRAALPARVPRGVDGRHQAGNEGDSPGMARERPGRSHRMG